MTSKNSRGICVPDPGNIRQKFRRWIRETGAVLVWSLPGMEPRPFRFTPNYSLESEEFRKFSRRFALSATVKRIDGFRFIKDLVPMKSFSVGVKSRMGGLVIAMTSGAENRVKKALAEAEEEYGFATFEFDEHTRTVTILVAGKENRNAEEEHR